MAVAEKYKAGTLREVQYSFDKLSDYLIANDFSGYEYDDLLASPFVSFMTFKSLWLKIAAVQTSKRSPINLRRILGVPKLKSTKGYGFVIKGYLYHHLVTGEEKYLPIVKEALQWLMQHSSKGYSGYCWGNDFDFASRAGYFPKYLPTIVWSAHIQESFDLAYRVFGNEEYKKVVISVADFIEKDLERMKDNSGYCIAYAPTIVKPIHNSNLLGVAALMRAYKHTGNKNYYDVAKNACNWSVAKQNTDGSWYYGDIPMLHWIDNYHTGYNLDCLCTAHEIGGNDFVDKKIITTTYNYWKKNLFEESGRPKFYYNKIYPSDIQATAQAIESFSKYSKYDPNAIDQAELVTNWALKNMQKENGSFRYRIHENYTNNLETIHWGQSTMLSSLAHLLYFKNPN